MGVALWLISGLCSWIVARIVPFGRARSRFAELSIALVAALLLGLTATALDFGGWREPDWRAGLFALFGALAAAGLFRLVATMKR